MASFVTEKKSSNMTVLSKPPSQIGRRNILKGLASGAALATVAGVTGTRMAQAGTLDNHVTLTQGRLDELAETSYSVFNENQVLAPYDREHFSARHDVELYRLNTYTQVPETGETVKVTGLLAVPSKVSGPIPVVSWQHGTIVSFIQVPSTLTLAATPGYVLQENVDSKETLFNVHRFAANGYAVIAADYLGKGPLRGSRPEAYAVKQPSVRTCIDILNAGLAAMKQLDLEPSELFLNGWSQGGLNTQWLRQELQIAGTPVVAAGAASPFNDLTDAFAYWTGGINFPNPTAEPYPKRPAWLVLATAILIGSYEAYYGLDGLMQSTVRPEYQIPLQKFWTDYAMDFDLGQLPMPEQLLIDGYFERYTTSVNSRFLRHLAANRATFWDYGSPMRLFYGLADEAIHPVMAQKPLPAGGRFIDGVAVSRASHRATFLASLYGTPAELQGKPNLLDWFNSMRSA